MATPRTYIASPALTPAKGGLLAVATIIASDRAVGFEYVPEACGPALVDIDRCNPPESVALSVTVDPDGDATLTIAEAPEDEELNIDWGDGTDTQETNLDPIGPIDALHTYTVNGTTTITVTGTTYGSQSVVVRIVLGQTSTGSSTNKAFEGRSLIEGDPFTVYKGVECDLLTTRDDEARAERGLRLGESRAVEAAVWETLLATSDAVDLTPGGGAVTVNGGIGMLEEYAGQYYGAVATIHAPRSLIPLMKDLEQVDGHLETIQGTKIANGFGYTANTGPEGTVAAAGEAWLYISGEVVLSQGPIATHAAPLVQNNRAMVLAERVYAPSVECFIAAVRVSLGGS